MDGLTPGLYLISAALVHPPGRDECTAQRQLQKNASASRCQGWLRQSFSPAEMQHFGFLDWGMCCVMFPEIKMYSWQAKISRSFSYPKKKKKKDQKAFIIGNSAKHAGDISGKEQEKPQNKWHQEVTNPPEHSGYAHLRPPLLCWLSFHQVYLGPARWSTQESD